MKRVYVTGLGFITSIGNDKPTVIRSLRELKHGMGLHPELAYEGCPVKVAGLVKDFDVSSLSPEDWAYPGRYHIKREVIRSFSPHVLFGYCAMAQAIEDAGLGESDISNPKTGLFTASGGSMQFINAHFQRIRERGVMRCNPLGVVASIAGTLNFNLVASFEILGASTGFTSACASSGHALGYATEEIRAGRQDRMFVVGAEDGNHDTIVPFCVMRALSLNPDPDSASRPYDSRRDGFVPTGGGVSMVLESEEEVKRRGIRPYAELLGWGQGSDGHSVAIAHPEGRGLHQAMKLALEDARLERGAIGYINAHAPSTPLGDLAEGRAVLRFFQDATPPISSTKALTGHGLSLSSIMEAAFCSIFLAEGFVPGSAHISRVDPEVEKLSILRQSEEMQAGAILSNSSGFGGANVSLVLGQC